MSPPMAAAVAWVVEAPVAAGRAGREVRSSPLPTLAHHVADASAADSASMTPRPSVALPATDAAGASDAEIVARVAAGDADALGLLYDRHGAAAYALAKAMLGGEGDAEEVVAGAFEQVWRSAARFDAARGSVGAWVTMMTRSRALDVLRTRRRRSQLLERAARADDDGLALPLGTLEAPDAGAERDETARAVRAALGELPAAQRQAIELAFFDGMSHADVAAALGEPLGTVKTRIRTALHKLRRSLGAFLPEASS